jgi:hypothetical protein
MSKFLKYISVFSFLIAGLTLSAHQLIPHDHHSSDLYTNQEKNCPVSNNNSNHNAGFPTHCHAFNNFISEKFRPFQDSQNIQFYFFTFTSLFNTVNLRIQVHSESIITFQKPVIDSYTLESSLLRAPPALA